MSRSNSDGIAPTEPDSGWREAQQLAARRRGASDDPIIQAAIELLRNRVDEDSSPEALAWPDPVETASRLASSLTVKGLGIECGILGRAPNDRICAALEIAEDVREAYERLFFDVRDHLEARTWVHQALLWHHLPHDPYLAGMVRAVRKLAFTGGPQVVMGLLPALPNLLASPDDPAAIKTEADRMASEVRFLIAVEEAPYDLKELLKMKRAGLIRRPRSLASQRRAIVGDIKRIMKELLGDSSAPPLRRTGRRRPKQNLG